jgi:hypothetical protein
MASKPRDYKQEYTEFHGKPEQVKKRAQRVKARRMLEKEGAVTKGDGKDVDHITPLKKNGTTARSNLRVRSVKANRGDKT